MELFRNKILLITGGTGTIGGALLMRLIDSDVKEIRVFSRDEKKQDDMRCRLNNDKLKFFIGDVRNRRSVDVAMKDVDFVFHAAALKQVGSCERFPIETVQTNVLGAGNVIDSAVDHGVEKLLVLSSDKAVYPTNAMGMSKAMMEKVMLAKSLLLGKNDRTVLAGVRFGNVMGSRGSVIPRFIELIRQGRDLRITDPEMTRFVLSIEESVDLILHAFQYARNGDIFIRKAPVIKIGTLAQALLKLTGSKVSTFISGADSGEKLSEVLLTDEEILRTEETGLYYKISRDFQEKEHCRDINEFHSDRLLSLNPEETEKLLLTLDFFKEDSLNNV